MYLKKEFPGRRLTAIRPAEAPEVFLQAFEKSLKHIVCAGVFKHCKKDGSLIDVEIYSGTIIHNNKSSRPAIVITSLKS